jgi:hypothetical protein
MTKTVTIYFSGCACFEVEDDVDISDAVADFRNEIEEIATDINVDEIYVD